MAAAERGRTYPVRADGAYVAAVPLMANVLVVLAVIVGLVAVYLFGQIGIPLLVGR